MEKNETAYVTVNIRVANSPYDYSVQDLLKAERTITLEVSIDDLFSMGSGITAASAKRIELAIHEFLMKLAEYNNGLPEEEKDGE